MLDMKNYDLRMNQLMFTSKPLALRYDAGYAIDIGNCNAGSGREIVYGQRHPALYPYLTLSHILSLSSVVYIRGLLSLSLSSNDSKRESFLGEV